MNGVLVHRDLWGGSLRMEVELPPVEGSWVWVNLGGGEWSKGEQ